MSKNVEYEERVMLNKEEYKTLLNYFQKQYPKASGFTHINHYFETKDLTLNAKGALLRLRKKLGGPSELTFKFTQDDGAVEISQILTHKEEELLLKQNIFPRGEVFSFLSKKSLPMDQIKEVGTLLTKRLEIPIDDYLFVLDENNYLNITDYNLEIEANTHKKAREIILQICEKFNLKFKSSYQTKSGRFFSLLTKL